MTTHEQVQAVLSTHFLCERLKCRLSRDRCVDYQTRRPHVTIFTGATKRMVHAPPCCRDGTCEQGRDLLLERGLLVRVDCPRCKGTGEALASDLVRRRGRCLMCMGAKWVPAAPQVGGEAIDGGASDHDEQVTP